MPYHSQVCEYLKTAEAEVWQWYASNRFRDDQSAATRFDLLKTCYRLDRDSAKDVYKTVDALAEKLSLSAPVTVYQSQHPQAINASLAYLPNEAHIVLHGPILDRLAPSEQEALFAHELGHLIFLESWDGECLIASQILEAMTLDLASDPSHIETTRLFSLYTEIFCDRIAMQIMDDPAPMIQTLVKLETSIESVDAQAYRKQAAEILQAGPVESTGISHPECYLRAAALDAWDADETTAAAKIQDWIAGPPQLESLDFISQQHQTVLTRQLIDALLTPEWMQTEPLLGHARLFFSDYHPPTQNSTSSSQDTPQEDAYRRGDTKLQQYFGFILLDFTTADPELAEASLALALDIAMRFELQDTFEPLAIRELRLRKQQLQQIKENRQALIKAASTSEDPTA